MTSRSASIPPQAGPGAVAGAPAARAGGVAVPGPNACPCCDGKLANRGEDITETLESIPRQYKVLQTVRERFCLPGLRDHHPAVPAPFHSSAAAAPGPTAGDDPGRQASDAHRPLNRQSETFAPCEGIELDVSTLADWVGACTAALAPLVVLIQATCSSASASTATTPRCRCWPRPEPIGRLWSYVRDDRPFGGPTPPAAMFHFAGTAGVEHPARHLAGYTGILQADAYAGFNDLYHRRPSPGRSSRRRVGLMDAASCSSWPTVAEAPLAIEAMRRIDASSTSSAP